MDGKVVGLDTAPVIYFIERNPKYIGTVRPFFESLDEGRFLAVTSTITLAEVLVHPLRLNDISLAKNYKEILLEAENLDTFPLSPNIATEAARIRAKHDLRTPDAVQLATAASANASHFLTNDSRLPTLPGLKILVVDDLLSFNKRDS